MKFVGRLRSGLARVDRLDPPLPFVFLLTTVALFVRMPNLLLTPSLWAEDLSLFIEDFLNSGLASVVQPAYGPGYHLLLPRLVAAGLAVIPLKYAELMFHAVDVCVIYFAFLATWICLPTKSFTSRVAACLAILYVPINSSSIYLNLVNTQWILGGITILLIVTDYVPHSRLKVGWCAALAVLCLTGPFSVIALPVIVARMLYYRDVKREPLFYSSILVPTVVQLITLGRFAAARLDITASGSLFAWYTGFVHVCRFIPNRPLFLLFVAFIGLLLRKLAKHTDRETTFQASCLLFVAASIAAAGFYSLRNMPELVGPFGPGERYFFIPFLLLIFFVLSTARGALQPIGLFFVGFACIANARPLAQGPDGRGPNYWRSHVEAARYLQVAPILTRPVWTNERFKHELRTSSPTNPPVARSLDLDGLEFLGLAASRQPQGGWMIARDAGAEADGPNLLNGSWNRTKVSVFPAGDNVTNVTVRAKENALFQIFPGIEGGGTLMFSFEARSDAPLTIEPHLTDYKSGVTFAANLGPRWQRFLFDLYIRPLSATHGGVYMVLNSRALGSFQIRNLRATLDTHERCILIRIPDECRAYDDIALTYSASSVAQPGLHRLNASATKDHFKEWNTQHRWVNGRDKKVLFAVPNEGTQWLRIRVAAPLEMRDMMLRCF